MPHKHLHKKYKVVFLDWNGTLSGSKFWGHLEDPNHPHNHIFQKLEKILFGEAKPLLAPWMRGQTTSEEILELVSRQAQLPPDLVFTEFVTSCKAMRFSTPNLTSLVHQLHRAGTKVVIATDNMDSFPRWTVPALKLNHLFDAILDSYTLKALKKDVNSEGKNLFFTTFLTKYHLKPGETTLIDDSADRDNKLSSLGIDYRQIEPVVGLEPELTSIISTL